MPKNIYSKREDLICGKIDIAQEIAIKLQSVELMELLDYIRLDAQKMENKLIYYKHAERKTYEKTEIKTYAVSLVYCEEKRAFIKKYIKQF